MFKISVLTVLYIVAFVTSLVLSQEEESNPNEISFSESSKFRDDVLSENSYDDVYDFIVNDNDDNEKDKLMKIIMSFVYGTIVVVGLVTNCLVLNVISTKKELGN